MEFSIRSRSPHHTRQIARTFSKILEPSDLVLFHGELGGGKTTFISGIAEGLDVKENVSSPSFTLINIYESKKNLVLIHCDFYRLESLQEILSTEIGDYLEAEGPILLIEWARALQEEIGKQYLEIGFTYTEEGIDERILKFQSRHAYWDRKCKRFREMI